MRWTQFLLTTQKEDPAEADIVSHKLMIRSGMLHKVAAGIYNYLPFCVRSIRKLPKFPLKLHTTFENK